MSTVMKAGSAKDEVRGMLDRLPDDCTLEDIQYHLYVRKKIEKMLEQLHDGEDYTQEEAEQWIKQRLGELVAQITPENVHGETDWGAATGREAW